MAKFFIHRPVFAWVLAFIVMLAGFFGLTTLPISQYPQIAPTTVRISATYTGANPLTVQNSVTTVIEDGLTGLDGLTYMTSNSTQGRSSITLVFDNTVDPDMAQVSVQNKLQLVQGNLPSAVTARGVSVTRSTSSILMIGALIDQNGMMTQQQLGDLLDRTIKDPIQRTDGVGSINQFSSPYAMRIWLDPTKLYKYALTPDDVTSAVSDQNRNVTVGNLGSLPVVGGQQITVPMNARAQLSTIEEFQRIALSTAADGSTIYLGDVARIEIDSQDLSSASRFNGQPSAGFGVNLAVGANAVRTAENVRATIAQIQPSLPDGVTVVYPFDTSPFVEQSINRVYHTLAEAVVLVFLVILVFLQSWRATIIPTIAVPIVLLGTFGVLSVFGMSINTLSMFALVLAIGLLVDDAIVVVENVERVMEEEKLDAVAATEKSMGEISSALVGIVLVLSAVFLPMAFMSGSTGVIYRQFSVTIISAMVLSLFVALILTPAMCASLLKPNHGEVKFPPARAFNRGVAKLTDGYAGLVGRLIRRPFRMVLVLVAVGVGIWYVYRDLPSSFVPPEDRGTLMAQVTTPDNATRDQTEAAVRDIENYLLTEQKDYVASVFAAVGFSFGGTGQNRAQIFIRLKDYAERPHMSAGQLAEIAGAHYRNNRLGQVVFMQPPAIQGMGSSSGFTMYLIDTAGNGNDALHDAADALVANGEASGIITGLRGNSAANTPSLQLDIDLQKAQAFGLSLSTLNSMLSTIFAGNYVNDFTLNQKLRQVIVQGDAPWRMQPEDVFNWYARNSQGEMVPFAAVMTQSWQPMPSGLVRYGGTNAIEITGDSAEGVSSGEAMAKMEELVRELPGNYGVAWVGLSLQERIAGAQEPILYALSALVVFLCLAALYESWSVPFSVMLSVPVGILGAMIAAKIFGQSNDVYFKVGMLTTIGLAARNAILIVEFAEALRKEGHSLAKATVMAGRLRLRPILMTTFAFALGVLPLAIATGAGAAAQHSIGIGMLGGITFSALFGIVMVPVLYVAVMTVVGRFPRRRRSQAVPAE
ncbi:multidrug efflux RND transporter permease subunit [Paenirhodobacter populi]|uniref:Efflux pump membrane transporter n=1 Tax=Paenirhodobacter populi TaxID=2306993 RepID=A0A443JPR5_9RHOB|nr:multidrug efflux RND transporter permease subunit [Sinirhodobacter populi]RWR08775.1 multidrug efflux RND transporter permease subunit [Sinirhodobacter populi]RWR22506.1 multidrug efflux RND transporter permease subunit [Sinirhodobacter populi]